MGQLEENLLRGLTLVTHYSGKGTAESALCDVADIMRLYVNASIPQIFCASACDISHMCREMLLRHDVACRPKHVFGDMLDRIPLQSPPLADCAADEVFERLKKDAGQLYNAQSSAFCFRHLKSCNLWDGLESTAPKDRERLLISAAGFTCTDWSPRRGGKRAGLQGRSAPVYYHWIIENQQLKADILFWENSSHFDPSLVEAHLGEEYAHIAVKVCPTMLGWPQTRELFFGVAVLRETCCFTGSAEDFLDWFRCRVEVEGDSLLQASSTEVLAMMRERALKRGHHVPEGEMPPLNFAVSPSGMVALDQYSKLRDQKSSRSRSFICDLDQNAGFASCGSFLHSFPTHSSVFSFMKQRLCTGREMLAAMGASS